MDHIIAEFALVGKVVFAAILGLLTGIERKGGEKGAGYRTFALITMGACLFTVIAVNAFGDFSPIRMVAQIISGIGFIGAGVIWKSKTESIHGLTTAAAMWVSAGVGIAVGVNYYLLAAFSTLMLMMILAKGHPLKEAKKNLIKNEENCEGFRLRSCKT